jgi:NADPH:quinone reductase-like Zn-dependent oxidoreductase
MAGLLETGKIRVAIDSVFALADAQKAHERGERGHLQGKSSFGSRIDIGATNSSAVT